MDRVNWLRTNGALSKTRDHCCGWKDPVNRVGDSERRLEVGTARTGLHTLAVWGSGVVRRKNPGPELQKIPKVEPKKKLIVDPGSRQQSTRYSPTMPAILDASSSKKRKSTKNAGAPSSKRRAVAEEDGFAETLSKVQELENQVAESRKYYNNIATLISMLNVDQSAKKPELAVAVSLCRVFSRLMAAGNLSESSRDAENEKIVVAWLKERCSEYQRALLSIIREADTTSQVSAMIPGDSLGWTALTWILIRSLLLH